jgi:hypothetical protein
MPLALLMLTSQVVFATSDLDLVNFNQVAPVQLEDLEQVNGLGGVIDIISNSNANLAAELTNNQVTNSINGFNIIDHGSFTSASGVFSIIQNTGNNVIIQDSTIITITISPD